VVLGHAKRNSCRSGVAEGATVGRGTAGAQQGQQTLDEKQKSRKKWQKQKERTGK
jgi:hypothetical protein